MPDEEQGGPYEEEHSDEDLLGFVEQKEVVSTREVAEHFDYTVQTARRRLKSLHQEGELEMKDVGKRFVWWISQTS